MSKTRVIIIDPRTRTVEEGQVETLEDMQNIVDGLIAAGPTFSRTGDQMMVNDDGLFLFDEFFEIGNARFCGPAFITGEPDEEGEATNAQLDLQAVRDAVKFLGPRPELRDALMSIPPTIIHFDSDEEYQEFVKGVRRDNTL